MVRRVETPNFDSIAADAIRRSEIVAGFGQVLVDQLAGVVRDQLRLAWNTRGAADIATIETDLSAQMGAMKAGPYIKNLDRALRQLDR
jgi:hypothetical protein